MKYNERWGLVLLIIGVNGMTYNKVIGNEIVVWFCFALTVIGLFLMKLHKRELHGKRRTK